MLDVVCLFVIFVKLFLVFKKRNPLKALQKSVAADGSFCASVTFQATKCVRPERYSSGQA